MISVYRQSAHRWLSKSSLAGRLPLLSARPAVTFSAEERHHPLTGTKWYCLVTEACRCEQLAQGCYAALSWWELNPRLSDCKSNTSLQHHCATLVTVFSHCIVSYSMVKVDVLWSNALQISYWLILALWTLFQLTSPSLSVTLNITNCSV